MANASPTVAVCKAIALRAARRAARLCYKCGLRKPVKPAGRCARCNKRSSDSSRKRRTARLAAGLCPTCGLRALVAGGQQCGACRVREAHPLRREQRLQNQRLRTQRLRDEAFAHYGAVCACCGEPHKAFLEFDHVENNGGLHRREDHDVNYLAAWLKSHGYPPGFQVLCCNCNRAKYRYGICPHEQERQAHADS